MRQLLVRNMVINAASAVWRFSFSFFLVPFIIHAVGDQAYGIWVLVLSFSLGHGLISLFDLGIESSVVKFVAEHHARREFAALNEVVSACFFIYAALGIIASTALAAFATFFLTAAFNIPAAMVGTARTLLYLLAIQILIEFPSLTFRGILAGLQRYDFIRTIEMARLALYGLLVVVFLQRGYGVVTLGCVTLLAALCRTFLLIILSWRQLPTLHLAWRISRTTYGKMLRFSGKIFIIRINAVIYNQMNTAIIGAFLISTLLTEYDVAAKVHTFAKTPLSLIGGLLVPAASQLNARGDDDHLQELFLKATKYTLVLCLPTAISAIVLAQPFLLYWMGPAFVRDTGLTQLYLLYLLYAAVVPAGYNFMIGMDRIEPILGFQVGSTVINLVLSVILVNSIGVSGVIIGTLVGAAVVVYPYLRHFLSTLRISWKRFNKEVLLRTYPQALLYAILLFLASRLYHPGSLIEVGLFGGVGVLCYLGLFYFTGTDEAERRMLWTALARRA